MTPQRVRLSRRKGDRKPEGAVTVARPTRWGNRFTLASAAEAGFTDGMDTETAYRFVTEVFADWLDRGPSSFWWHEPSREQWQWQRDHLPELRGRDLACWCHPDLSCHADVLLDRANR